MGVLNKYRFGLLGWTIFLTSTSIFIFLGFILYSGHKNQIVTKSEKTLLYMKGKQEESLSDLGEELSFLSKLTSVQNYKNEATTATEDLIQAMKTKPGYDQIRVLDTTGREVIRVNKGNVPEVVDSTQLQHKGNRDYFEQAKLLEQGEFYASPISLNVENGVVESPTKPVIQLLTPIYHENQKMGYLAINFLILHLLDNYDLIVPNGNRFDILDNNGTSLISLLGRNSSEENLPAQKLQDKTKNKKNRVTKFEDDTFYYTAIQLESNEQRSELTNQLKQSTNSSTNFTLVHVMPRTELNAFNADFFWVLLISFFFFSVAYWFGYYTLKSRLKQHQYSELKLDSIFNKTLSFVGLVSPDGILLDINDTALNFGGFSREEAIGYKFWDAPWWSLSSEIRQNLQLAIHEASKGKSVRYDVEVVGANDQRIIIDFSLQPVRDEDGEIIYIIPEGRDITEKVTLQKNIEKNNQLYKAVRKLSNTGVWSVNLKADTLFWDEVVYAIHELEKGTPLNIEEGINFYREDFRELVRSSIDNAIQNDQNWDFEAVLITAKGNEVWVRAIGYPVFEDGELIELRGTFANIHERKMNEEALAEQESKLRLAMDSAKLGMWDWDLENDILNWDQSLYKMYGIKESDFAGAYESWKNSVHPDDLEKAQNHIIESIDFKKPLDMKFRIITGTGEIRHLKANASVITNDDGMAIRLIGVNKDITRRVEDETKIRELNANLEDKVLERTAELNKIKVELEQQLDLLGITAMVSESNINGEIINVNDAFCGLTGYTEDELIGQKHSILKSGLQHAEFYQSLWETISNGKTWQGELCNRNKNGEMYWVHATIHPFQNKENSITRYVGVYFDISELKESTRKLSEMNAQLDAANRELETFSYSVSHDLKAPLRALQGFSKNIIEKYESSLDETGVRWLQFIQDNAARMDNLIGDILSYSKIGKAPIKRSEFSMIELVQEKIASIREGYANQPEVVIMDDLPDIPSDHTMLGVIWQNLIDNAFKYSQHTESAKIQIWAETDEKGVTYFVKDNGSGFDMRHYDKLFGIFQRLHSQNEFEGTGVGLANVQRIIKKHNGTISAIAEVNEGATFQFFIPFKTIYNEQREYS